MSPYERWTQVREFFLFFYPFRCVQKNWRRNLFFPLFFRCVCPHGTFGPRCKIRERYFQGDEELRRKRSRVSGDGSWVWLPALPSCSQVHISLQILTKEPEVVLLFSGSSYISITPEFENFQKAKRQTYHQSGNIPRLKRSKRGAASNDTFAKISSVRVLKSRCSNQNISSCISTRNAGSGRRIRHMKSNFRKLNREQKRSSHANLEQRIDWNEQSRSSSAGGVGYSSLPLNFTAKSLYRSRARTKLFIDRQRNSKGNFLNENQSSRTRRNHPKASSSSASSSEEQQETGDPKQDFILLYLKKGRPHLLLNLGGGNIALSLASAGPLNDNRWHQLDIIWRDKVTII